MKKRRTGNLKLIQELNRSIVLDVIRQKGPISRSDIAKHIGVSPTTVTSAVSELIKTGLVYEDGVGNSSGGRKPVLLRFNPVANTVIGVSISNSMIKIADMNLDGKIIREEVHETNQYQGDAIIQFFLKIVENFLEKKEDLTSCQGISIIVPGIVNAEKGIVVYNSKLKLYDIPLKQLLEEQTKLPTFIDNDANAFVLAENYFGSFHLYNNLFVVTIGDGVGSGLMINGSIYRGLTSSSGEFGHTTVVPDGVKCDCGNRGCLENYINWPSIYSKVVTALVTKGRETVIRDLIANDISQITPAIFVEAIRQSDKLALDILDEIAEYLAIGLKNAIHMFNPEVVILSGKITQDNPELLEIIKEKVTNKVIPFLKGKVNIQSTSLGERFELLGAAAVLLHGKFNFQIT